MNHNYETFAAMALQHDKVHLSKESHECKSLTKKGSLKYAISMSLLIIVSVCILFVIVKISMTKITSTTLTITNHKQKPNFVFILTDDVGWNSVGNENTDLAFTTPFLK